MRGAFLLCSVLLAVVLMGEAKKLILDVDGAIEDMRGIILAIRSEPENRVLAITCSNSYITARQCVLNMDRVLRLLGREDIPLYEGAGDALMSRKRDPWPFNHGIDGFGNKPNLEPRLTADVIIPEESASIAMVRLAKEHKGEITIVCTGPLTNLALAQKINPKFSKNIHSVYMAAGNLFGVGMIPTHPAAEYNIHMDPEAAYIVLTEFRCPLITMPFETVSERQSNEMYGILNIPVRRDAFLYSNGTVADFVREINTLLVQDMKKSGREFTFWDEVPVAAALDPSGVIIRSKAVSASVELRGQHTRGQMAVDWINKKSRKNLRIITEYSESRVARMMVSAVEPQSVKSEPRPQPSSYRVRDTYRSSRDEPNTSRRSFDTTTRAWSVRTAKPYKRPDHDNNDLDNSHGFLFGARRA